MDGYVYLSRYMETDRLEKLHFPAMLLHRCPYHVVGSQDMGRDATFQSSSISSFLNDIPVLYVARVLES